MFRFSLILFLIFWGVTEVYASTEKSDLSILHETGTPDGNEGDEGGKGKKEDKKEGENTAEIAEEEGDIPSMLIATSNVKRPELKTEFFEWEFHPFLIPASDIYCEEWDSLNVDIVEFNPRELHEEISMCLTDGDCGYVHPFMGTITSKFGWRHGRMHKGIDIDLRTGDSVVAAFDGVVRIEKNDPGGFGNYVLIRHYNGLETIYAHLSEAWVTRNQFVRAGEVIGLGGNTGRSTGSHLHFETRYLGQPIDPSHVIDFETGQLKSDTLVIKKELFSPAVGSYTARYHKIRSGDTLYGLARRYGTTVSALCRMNGISKNSILRIGKVLRVR